MGVVKAFSPPKPLETAVLFLIFRRPDTTKQVFEQIRKARPPRLYIAADGPRENVPGEAELVMQTREYVLNNIDWDCEVKTLFRDKNLGCGRAVSEAITWFFEHEEMGIILEDDTVPSLSFFWFCEELLKRYKDDMRVGMITGTSYLFNEIKNNYEDFFFSRYFAIWGWATWRNRWEKYDITMRIWPEIKRRKILRSIFYWDTFLVRFFENYYELIYQGKVDTWDAQWTFLCRVESQYCIMPYLNLISNIGIYGTRKGKGSPFINMPRVELNISQLKNPSIVCHNLEIDKLVFYNVFYKFSKLNRLKKIFYSLISFKDLCS